MSTITPLNIHTLLSFQQDKIIGLDLMLIIKVNDTPNM